MFSHQKTFNETNLFSLGIDLNSTAPLLPKLKSIISELPFGEETEYEIPEFYEEIENQHESEDMFISKASDECLMFIFYSKPRTKSQLKAARELEKREFSFIDQKWRNRGGAAFNQNKWMFEEANT